METPKTVERVESFLRSAEKTGLLDKLEREALAQHDEQRTQLAAELLEVVALRSTRLEKPTQVVARAQERHAKAIAALNASAAELDAAIRAVWSAEAGSDAAEGKLRRAMLDIAPPTLDATWRKLHFLSLKVKSAFVAREFTMPDGRGGYRAMHEDNAKTVFPLQEWLEHAKEEITEMSYEPQTAAALTARCEALVGEARRKATPLLGIQVVEDELKDETR